MSINKFKFKNIKNGTIWTLSNIIMIKIKIIASIFKIKQLSLLIYAKKDEK